MNPPGRRRNLPRSESDSKGHTFEESIKRLGDAANTAWQDQTTGESSETTHELSTEPAKPSGITSVPKPVLPDSAAKLKIPPILFEGDETAPAPPTKSGPKFALELAPVACRKEPEEAVLPESYGTGRLWLAARDPHCLYASWDLTSEQQSRYNAVALGQHLVIRIHLDMPLDRGILEVQLRPDSQHWFINVPLAGRRYVAELGYYQADQQWESVAVSEPISTPPEGLAREKTVRFATLRAQNLAPPQPMLAPSAPRTAEAPQETQPGPASNTSEPITAPATSVGLPEPYSLASAFVQGVLPELLEPWLATISEWTPAQEAALARLLDWRSVQIESPTSGEMIELPPSSMDLGAPIGLSSLQETLSSPAGGEIPRQEHFWFSVNAELVIYGATDPNARVTIGGRPIQLRPDGTFSYRFALPDGHYELPIAATSAQGDLRKADLEFFRNTNYQGDVQAHAQDPGLKKPETGNVS